MQHVGGVHVEDAEERALVIHGRVERPQHPIDRQAPVIGQVERVGDLTGGGHGARAASIETRRPEGMARGWRGAATRPRSGWRRRAGRCRPRAESAARGRWRQRAQPQPATHIPGNSPVDCLLARAEEDGEEDGVVADTVPTARMISEGSIEDRCQQHAVGLRHRDPGVPSAR